MREATYFFKRWAHFVIWVKEYAIVLAVWLTSSWTHSVLIVCINLILVLPRLMVGERASRVEKDGRGKEMQPIW